VPALDHRLIRLKALPDGFQTEFIETAERGQPEEPGRSRGNRSNRNSRDAAAASAVGLSGMVSEAVLVAR